MSVLDGWGIYGSVMHSAFLLALVGSSLLVFVYLWRKGKLDFDEDAKIKMMQVDGEEKGGENGRNARER